MSHERVDRLCTEAGLSIRTKLPGRKRARRYQQGRPGDGDGQRDLGGATQGSTGIAGGIVAEGMDFLSDPLFDGRPIRMSNSVEYFPSTGVRRTLNQLPLLP